MTFSFSQRLMRRSWDAAETATPGATKPTTTPGLKLTALGFTEVIELPAASPLHCFDREMDKTRWLSVGEWKLGQFWYQPDTHECWVSLTMRTNVMRGGKTYQIGWGGAEEEIARYSDLKSYDVFHYKPLSSGEEPKEGFFPNIVVEIVPLNLRR